METGFRQYESMIFPHPDKSRCNLGKIREFRGLRRPGAGNCRAPQVFALRWLVDPPGPCYLLARPGTRPGTPTNRSAMSLSRKQFLPVTLADLHSRGIDAPDFVFVSGDAYVDHPAFAAALICRLLESQGFTTGIIAQPDLADPESMKVLGRPRLGFLVGAGAMDSMVNHYTAARKPRSDDAYTPGGKAGKRPDRALIRYVNALRAVWKDVPVVVGGIEASLRRLTHYDYWSDTVKRSVLLDSKADILVYGMGERQILEIARRLSERASGEDTARVPAPAGRIAESLAGIRGTVVMRGKPPAPGDIAGATVLPSHQEQASDKAAFARAWKLADGHTDPSVNRRLWLPDNADGSGRWILQEPPALPLDTEFLDRVYGLPFTRETHPDHLATGTVPALEEVRFSLVSSRGCYGGCSFCALTFHQGRIVTARSRESLLEEARSLTAMEGFKGNIHDVGGPTANFFGPACTRQENGACCTDRPCLGQDPCKSLRSDHRDYTRLLKDLRQVPGVKKVFVRSGIRFDAVMRDRDDAFLEELAAHHVSGRLKVAPEHVSDRVLALMGKPRHEVYEAFRERFDRINSRLGKNQYVVPYFISSHPGSTLEDAVELALYLQSTGHVPDAVQDFYPTPGTRSTCMFHTGLDPVTMKEVYVARGEREKALQRALLQYNHPANAALVREALAKAGRRDLIGTRPSCLVRP